jgi:uncharacterized protein YndB with AHSA1/START domain
LDAAGAAALETTTMGRAGNPFERHLGGTVEHTHAPIVYFGKFTRNLSGCSRLGVRDGWQGGSRHYQIAPRMRPALECDRTVGLMLALHTGAGKQCSQTIDQTAFNLIGRVESGLWGERGRSVSPVWLNKPMRVISSLLATAAMVAWLGSVTTLAQRPRRPAKTESSGPIAVTRAATLRVTIARDTLGIFDYLSDATKLTLWFPDQAIFQPQVGGKYHFRWKNIGGVWSGVVTEFIRGNTLAFTWQPPNEPYETNVRIRLLPQDSGTAIVELTHSGFTSVESLNKAIEAWRFYLQNLKSAIETGSEQRKKGVPRSSPTLTRTRKQPA